MPSNYETFWSHQRYAVVGHSVRKPFAKLTYGALKKRGKTVYAIDTSAEQVDGDPAYQDLSSLPGPVDAVVLEVPKEETADWMQRAAAAGIKDVWIHMQRDTPQALGLARDKGINVRHGTCAVMYLEGGYHKLHKWINKLRGAY